ncbi:MAG: PKD domain-containing protein [Bacteroidota bacterium]|nr:PKD domain-containing protein [Bacteroidota bacterium]
MMAKNNTLLLFLILFSTKIWAQPCLVNFSSLSEDINKSTCSYKEFNFTLNGGTPQSYKWFYGDGNSCTCSKPKNFYKKNDTFQLIGIVYDANGCADSVFQDVIIKCDNPCDLSDIAIYSADTLYYECNEVEFNAIVSQSTKELTWDFGDGETSNNKFDIHLYADNGSYDARLIIKDSIGCADTSNFTILIDCDDIIDPEPCDFRITLLDTNSTSKCKEKLLTVAANHRIQNILWWTNDSGYFNGTSSQTIRYTDTGLNQTCVLITDSLGCKDSTCMDVMIKCIEETLSIQDARFSNLKIYPNPTQDWLNISNANHSEYIITDILGQIISTGKLNIHHFIDVSMFKNGLYVLKLIHPQTPQYNHLFYKN